MNPWVEKAVQIIVDLYAPERILLFGSQAKGTVHAASDVDLIVIKKTDVPKRFRGAEVMERLGRYPMKFDLLFYTPKELEEARSKPHSFIHSLQKSAVKVYEKL